MESVGDLNLHLMMSSDDEYRPNGGENVSVPSNHFEENFNVGMFGFTPASTEAPPPPPLKVAKVEKASVVDVVNFVAKGEIPDDFDKLSSWTLEEKRILLKWIRHTAVRLDLKKLHEKLPHRSLAEIRNFLRCMNPGTRLGVPYVKGEIVVEEDSENNENEVVDERQMNLKQCLSGIKKRLARKKDRSHVLKDVFRMLTYEAAKDLRKQQVLMKGKIYVVDFGRLYQYVTDRLAGVDKKIWLSAAESSLLLETIQLIQQEATSDSCDDQREFLIDGELDFKIADDIETDPQNYIAISHVVKADPDEVPEETHVDMASLNPLGIPSVLLDPVSDDF